MKLPSGTLWIWESIPPQQSFSWPAWLALHNVNPKKSIKCTLFFDPRQILNLNVWFQHWQRMNCHRLISHQNQHFFIKSLWFRKYSAVIRTAVIGCSWKKCKIKLSNRSQLSFAEKTANVKQKSVKQCFDRGVIWSNAARWWWQKTFPYVTYIFKNRHLWNLISKTVSRR